jgi:hypothetical protein
MRCTVTVLLSLVVLTPRAAVGESVEQANQHYPVLREFWRTFAGELQQQYMTGAWGGLRERLVTAGITPTITYTADVLGNLMGAQRRAMTYSGGLSVDMRLDVERSAAITILTPIGSSAARHRPTSGAIMASMSSWTKRCIVKVRPTACKG